MTDHVSVCVLSAAPCPPGETVFVSLNEVVRLPCPLTSHHAQRLWEGPDGRISPHLYIHLDNGGLCFVATPDTLGPYLCLSTEKGYQHTLAIYHVRKKTITPTPATSTHPFTRSVPITSQTGGKPRGFHPATSAGAWTKMIAEGTRRTVALSVFSEAPRTLPATRPGALDLSARPRDLGLNRGDKLLLAHSPSYLKELVVVSVLLVLSLSVLLTAALYGIRQRCHKRTAPQASSLNSSSSGGLAEGETLRGELLHVNSKQTNGQAVRRSGQTNGQVSTGTPKGSNGHLPNTPI